MATIPAIKTTASTIAIMVEVSKVFMVSKDNTYPISTPSRFDIIVTFYWQYDKNDRKEDILWFLLFCLA
jgi:hypothetical protein